MIHAWLALLLTEPDFLLITHTTLTQLVIFNAEEVPQVLGILAKHTYWSVLSLQYSTEVALETVFSCKLTWDSFYIVIGFHTLGFC